jgi:hypothetical protein
MTIRKRFLFPALLVAFVVGMLTSALMAQQHRVRTARELLFKAQEHLMQAHGEFGGHRLKAMELVKAAVMEVDAALAVDR